MSDTAIRGGSIQKYVMLGFWVLLAGTFISLAAQWISFTSSDRQLTEYADSLVRRAAIERLPARDVRALVQQKAAELSIPVQEQGVSVTGLGETLTTSIAYGEEIKVPIMNRVVYRMSFTHYLAGVPLKQSSN
jgi:hypothetical protein